MINCPKFAEMQKMFQRKFVIITKVQPIAKTQLVTANVNVVDVNVTTRSKTAERKGMNIYSSVVLLLV
jgi:hypothetical protein